jgi:hypothetical protein
MSLGVIPEEKTGEKMKNKNKYKIEHDDDDDQPLHRTSRRSS